MGQRRATDINEGHGLKDDSDPIIKHLKIGILSIDWTFGHLKTSNEDRTPGWSQTAAAHPAAELRCIQNNKWTGDFTHRYEPWWPFCAEKVAISQDKIIEECVSFRS